MVTEARPPRLGPAALKAFTHPLRMAMFEYLRDHGPATATQLAEAMGESSGQTSYHLRQLARHGFLEDDPGHAGGRERWWRPVGFHVDSTDLADDAVRGAIAGLMSARVTIRADLVRRWLERLPEEPEDWRGAGADTEGRAWMTAAELTALAEELEETMVRHIEAAAARREGGDGLDRRRVRIALEAFPVPMDTAGPEAEEPSARSSDAGVGTDPPG